ncbi:transglutaminase domain-containing protein [Ornithinibacillus salinisoli]|uniref:Transglutaminase domain-containing protein n=1 Tax=Ornithinibacillus salinisoli TaxID=1848459 RepID=A0ABW4VVG6_9BACI
MKRIFKLMIPLIIIFYVISGCSNNDATTDDMNEDDGKEVIADVEEDIPEIQYSSYAEEVGFSLVTPTNSVQDIQTTIEIRGKVEKGDDLTGDLLWIVINPKQEIEELQQNEFNYYVSIADMEFSKEISMHYGAGEYDVSIRVPSNKETEEGSFYEVASFSVTNTDKKVQREVEYTQYGVTNNFKLNSPEVGLSKTTDSVLIEGELPESYMGDMVLVQVEKDQEARQVILPVSQHEFSGDIPLYFGEGIHYIRVQLFNETDELYYDAATFYVENETDTAFAEMETYRTYIEHGVTLYEPTWKTAENWDQEEYRVAGEIDPSIPGADQITHIIVMMNYMDENLEAGYLIPVENYQFDGSAYFRFGPGDYEVVVNIPSMEQHDQSMFYFQSVAKVNHHVTDISDQRDLLPSRGIESDHPAIIQKAEEITAGVSNERDKAKAVFEFVSHHVAYDVEKAENDIFNIGDSALSTLESGIGICQDYAFLATALLRAVGMEAHYVEGYAGERHAWVEVNVDEDWIEMDPTWGAGYIQDGQFHFNYNEDYFDPDPTFFAETHTREGIMY